jgi:hypothetical protein
MHKQTKHRSKINPVIFQRAFFSENALFHSTQDNSNDHIMTEDQIRFVKSSTIKLNKTTEELINAITDSVKQKLEHIFFSEQDSSAMKRVKIDVYMPIMCSPFCIANEDSNEQIIHINAPVQFSPVQITNSNDDPVE